MGMKEQGNCPNSSGLPSTALDTGWMSSYLCVSSSAWQVNPSISRCIHLCFQGPGDWGLFPLASRQWTLQLAHRGTSESSLHKQDSDMVNIMTCFCSSKSRCAHLKDLNIKRWRIFIKWVVFTSRIISVFFQDQAYYPTPGQEHFILNQDLENSLQLQKNFRIKMPQVPYPYCRHPQLVLISLGRVKRTSAFHQMLLWLPPKWRHSFKKTTFISNALQQSQLFVLHEGTWLITFWNTAPLWYLLKRWSHGSFMLNGNTTG